MSDDVLDDRVTMRATVTAKDIRAGDLLRVSKGHWRYVQRTEEANGKNALGIRVHFVGDIGGSSYYGASDEVTVRRFPTPPYSMDFAVEDLRSKAVWPMPNKTIAVKVAEMHGWSRVIPYSLEPKDEQAPTEFPDRLRAETERLNGVLREFGSYTGVSLSVDLNTHQLLGAEVMPMAVTAEVEEAVIPSPPVEWTPDPQTLQWAAENLPKPPMNAELSMYGGSGPFVDKGIEGYVEGTRDAWQWLTSEANQLSPQGDVPVPTFHSNPAPTGEKLSEIVARASYNNVTNRTNMGLKRLANELEEAGL